MMNIYRASVLLLVISSTIVSLSLAQPSPGLPPFDPLAQYLNVPQQYGTIQSAINAASTGDIIIVADGTYNEQNITITNKAVTIKSANGAGSTIVDAGGTGRGFVISHSENTAVNLIGLTIQNALIPYYSGGGAVYVTLGKVNISNCTIQGITGNAAYSGGPIYNDNSTNPVANVVVSDCIVRNNFAANGCGISGSTVYNSLIYNNSAGNNPMALAGCNSFNCTVYNNTGGYLPNPWTAGGMAGGTAVNCIFWGNSGNGGQQIDRTGTQTVTYSIIQNGWAGTGNLSGDPLFVNPGSADFHLQAGSPAINAGDPAIFDLDGSRSDIGAFSTGNLPLSMVFNREYTFNSGGSEVFRDLVELNGSIYIAGEIFTGFGDERVTKVDKDGNVIWTFVRAASWDNDGFGSIEVNNQNELVCYGQQNNGATYFDASWVIYDETGVEKNWGNLAYLGSNTGTDLNKLPNGNFLAVGPGINGGDFIALLDNSMTLIRLVTFPHPADWDYSRVIPDNNGNVFVFSSNSTSGNSHVYKLTEDLQTTLWSKTITGVSLRDLLLYDGSLMVSGITSSSYSYVAKINTSDGNLQNSQTGSVANTTTYRLISLNNHLLSFNTKLNVDGSPVDTKLQSNPYSTYSTPFSQTLFEGKNVAVTSYYESDGYLYLTGHKNGWTQSTVAVFAKYKINLITNAAPTDITISNALVQENSILGKEVGQFTAPDAEGGTMTYSLVSGTGSTDNTSFIISAAQLKTASAIDYETKSSYSIRVRATDSGGLSFEKQFTISVTDVLNESIPTNGLVAWYPFNGNANDESGNGNNGTVYGATLITNRFGNLNTAFSFDGNDYIDCGNSTILDLFNIPTKTISFWMKTSDILGGAIISRYSQGISSNSAYAINSSAASIYASGNGTNAFSINTQESYDWQHYVIEFNRAVGNVRITKNGSFLEQGNLNFNSGATTVSTLIGMVFDGNTNTNPNYFKGVIDDIAIYNRALSDSEITQLYTAFKQAQTITFNSLNPKTYGDASFALTASSNSGLGITYTSSDPNVASVSGSTVTIKSAGTTTITASQDGNDVYGPALPIQQTLTVNKATLTATADNKNRVYGDANPAFTITYTGFKNSETSTVVDTAPIATTTATLTSNAGNYAIVPAGGTDNNYTFSYVSGTITINKATLTATADNKSRIFGDANPAFTITYTGYKNSETSTVIDTSPTATTTAVLSSNVGSYNIVPASGTDNNYTFTYVNGTLTINKATLTATADNKSRVYGDSNLAFTITYTGFKNNETSTVFDAAPTSTTTAIQSSNVGNYSIVPAGGTDNNYTFTYVNGMLTITKATLITTADNKSRVYGDANPNFTIAYTGFKNSETSTVIDTAPAATTTATLTSNVGNYSIVPAGGTDNNYSFTYANGVLTIAKAMLTVTADNKSRLYGDANPAFTITFTGFKNSETSTVIDTAPTAISSATAASNVGTYNIIPSGGTDNNYSFTYVNGTLTINKATLTATADNKSRLYGDANPALTITYTGFKNSETSNVIDASPSATTSATLTSNAGAYTIIPSGGTDNNYSFTYSNGTLTITQVTLAATADNKSRVYGEANPTLTITYTGFKNGETSTVIDAAPTVATTATLSSHVGTYDLVPAGGTDNNYSFTYANGTLTITKAVLMATAENKSRVYGDANPTFTITYAGLKNNDAASVIDLEPTATTSATLASNVGTYSIGSAGGNDNNYSFTYTNGTLTITKAMLTVSSDNKSREYGNPDPAFTMTYTGFKNGQTSSVVNTAPTATTSATLTSNAGTYAIVHAGGVDNNYDFAYVNGTLTITKAALIATADDASRGYGEVNSTYTISYSGFKNGETSSVIDTTPTATTMATQTNDVGTYNISVTGGVDNNYDFTYANGTLTIAKAILTATADNKTRLFGDVNPLFTITYTGFKNAESASVIDTAPSATSTATPTSASGTYSIIPSGGADNNYSFTYVDGTLTILGLATQSITFTTLTDKPETAVTFFLDATSSSGLAVTFSTPDTDKVTIAGSIVSILKPGKVTIVANQGGNIIYQPANTVSQTICILPKKPTITGTGLGSENVVLTSSSTSGNQWYRNETVLAGATSQTHLVKEKGLYQVKVTIDGCASELSDQFAIIVTDVIDPENSISISLYPNPAGQELRIKLTGVEEDESSELVVYDLTGRVISKQSMKGEYTSLLLDQYSSGNYVLHISNTSFSRNTRFTKQ